MNNLKIELKDGTSVNLSFSTYFLARCSQLFGLGLNETLKKLEGDVNTETLSVSGGIFDDLNVRAVVIASAIEADGFANKDYSKKTEIDGFEVMNLIPSSISNPVWGEIFQKLRDSLIAENLPKDDHATSKKKAAKRQLPSVK